MKKYEMKITPHTDASGQSYWVVNFPAIDACSGGGYTVEDAIKEAEENLKFYLEYLENEKIRLPEEYKENSYSGKIALRVSKSTHKKATEIAESEGISLNLLLNNAIEFYLGQKTFDMGLNDKIQQIKEVSESSFELQKVNYLENKAIENKLWENSRITWRD